jgi:ribosomal protein S12 methylthiotransferase
LLSTLADPPIPPGAGPFWIRFLYGHPQGIDDGLLTTVAHNAAVCSYIDIPIQHASRPVLERMGRQYGPDDLHRLLERIRRHLPTAALRTTVIVGFPGETDADFNRLLRFVESERFDHLGCFVYSDAEDLPAHGLAGHVSDATAQERYRALMTRQRDISADRNRRHQGRKLTVLIEEHQEEGMYTGRTEFQAPEVDGVTHVHANRLKIGSFVDVRITDTLEYDLVGTAL